jgi:hypothetical protein
LIEILISAKHEQNRRIQEGEGRAGYSRGCFALRGGRVGEVVKLGRDLHWFSEAVFEDCWNSRKCRKTQRNSEAVTFDSEQRIAENLVLI